MDRLPMLACIVLLPALGGCSPTIEPATTPRRLTEGTTLLDYHGPADAFGHRVAPAAAMAACEWHHPLAPEAAVLCERHQVALIDDVIPICYGFPFSDAPGFDQAEREDFPNHAARFLGGCVLGEEHWVAVAYCPTCREAELEWERASAAAGHPESYDAASREKIRKDIAAVWPPPALAALR
jgi:hypothetical protein